MTLQLLRVGDFTDMKFLISLWGVWAPTIPPAPPGEGTRSTERKGGVGPPGMRVGVPQTEKVGPRPKSKDNCRQCV